MSCNVLLYFIFILLRIEIVHSFTGHANLRQHCFCISGSNNQNTLLYAGFGNSASSQKVDGPAAVIDQNSPCSCGSGSMYSDCCGPVHAAGGSTDPEKVVRSRFSALVNGLIPHMVKTTHPDHKEFVPEEQTSKRKKWIRDLASFSTEYKFLELIFDDESRVEVLGDKAHVSFTAKLLRVSASHRLPEEIKEKSLFRKDKSTQFWLYAGVHNPAQPTNYNLGIYSYVF